nr:ribonuclease H-like domain-containing protein [Tanacetum cinerariifolium]
IRSTILSREVLPGVKSAHAIISSEETYRVVSGNFQRSQVSNNFQRPSSNVRPNDNGSSRTAEGSNLICENCDFNGHTIDRCFKIIGYPLDFGKKKVVQNFKGKNVSNNAVRTSSSSGFSDEQLSTLISLIKENSVNGNGVQANMAEAFITKIRNMPLIDYLTLFDVLVVPEYYVSLMYDHKVSRDRKLVIAFDELKCYILNQDLKAQKVLGTGRQFGGLYYFDGNQGLNNADFFNLDGSIDHSEIPYDDERSKPRLNGYGTPSSHSGSTFDTHNENEGGHSLGSDAAASKDDRSANPEDNINNNSEGNGPLFIS